MHAMDIDDLRAVMTVVSFVAFLGIVAWAYGRARKHAFEDAALLPFTHEPGEELATLRGTEGER
jgi:cytochrome c oxidase cbb3-type subunit 4